MSVNKPQAHVGTHRNRANRSTWGFEDTRYSVNAAGNLEISGSRYCTSGQELPSLFLWAKSALGLKDDTFAVPQPSLYPPRLLPATINEDFIKRVTAEVLQDKEQLSQEKTVRIRHGHGQTQQEIYGLNFSSKTVGRVPDVVVFPAGVEEVWRLVQLATECDVCMIPFGGGTNVSQALRCPATEARMIISVDMQRMARIRWVDKVNRLACIEAGAVGQVIEHNLGEKGFCLGHEPDSIEFSTLGGWIATKASGMKRLRYGNIEDLVMDVEAVTAAGVWPFAPALVPRDSVGANPKHLLFGSEGTTAIITAAIVKLQPLPSVRTYDCLLFSSFETGVQFMQAMSQASRHVQPASLRLVDSAQLQLSQALRPRPGRAGQVKQRLQTAYLQYVQRFKFSETVACTLLFEETLEEIRSQQRLVHKTSRSFHGLHAGTQSGRHGYELTFSIAYLRDFIMRYGIFGESFETSCPWTKVNALRRQVRERVAKEHRVRDLPGRPFLSCRISQVYETGATVYFYLGLYMVDVKDPSGVYAEIEAAARDEILKCGGSLSHHHGVGKLRQRFLRRAVTDMSLTLNAKIKREIDPGNIFGCGNLLTTSNDVLCLDNGV
ncbi:FAD-binding oxidoreductase [Aspergillus saccharolyticus JOP 1030-1]|uniref:Alkylglycerone-phosphate synthase n=1 Tax=Aspergillus saccharolyticus JOP 1030-1 TaxID=1450539 RepID=A0A318ZEP6_9EURO|nr:FAD-binding domain-containing protein [Aspergillus saccharolyticus JOP 1030-1]PYH44744.1 FAD-binding domain-containing protein [Aspergillus saccharolyticus JOP 1030-1]